MEDKKLFVAKLFEAIKLCSNARGLVSLEYHEHLTKEEAGEKAHLDGFRLPGEYVVATFDDGYQNFIFVGGDSCWGIFYELDRYLF